MKWWDRVQRWGAQTQGHTNSTGSKEGARGQVCPGTAWRLREWAARQPRRGAQGGAKAVGGVRCTGVPPALINALFQGKNNRNPDIIHPWQPYPKLRKKWHLLKTLHVHQWYANYRKVSGYFLLSFPSSSIRNWILSILIRTIKLKWIWGQYKIN